MKQVEVAVIGTGWCGGIRAETLSRSALVRQAAHLRNPPGPAGRGEGAHQARDRDARLSGHHQERRTSRWSTSRTTPETNHYPIARDCLQRRQARAAGKADRAGAVGGRRADHARQAQQPEIHHRLFAALQSRRFAYAKKKITDGTLGKVVSRAGEPRICRAASARRSRSRVQALAGGDGIDPRPRFRLLAAGAGQAGAGLFAGRLRLHAADQRLLRRACGPPSPWTTACW